MGHQVERSHDFIRQVQDIGVSTIGHQPAGRAMFHAFVRTATVDDSIASSVMSKNTQGVDATCQT